MKGILVFCVMAVSFAAQAANTWFVDDDNYGKSGLDGTTEAKAYGTIQDAIDAATTVDGDTIKVLPGVYTNGVTLAGASEEYSPKCRVYLTKGVNLVATSSDPTATKIVGHQDFESSGHDNYGNGPNAVKCIQVKCSGQTVTIQGFTICQGATLTYGNEGPSYSGGGVTVAAGTAWVADCVLTGNTARVRGGAAYGGNFLRCKFWGNNAARGYAEVCYNSVAVFCVFARGEQSVDNTKDSCLCRNSTLVNCTIANNANALVDFDNTIIGGGFDDKDGCYNCVFSANRLLSDELCTNAYATVSSTNLNGEAMLMAAALGDFRPTAGKAADGAGETKYLMADKPFGDLPSGLALTDMEGNPFDSSSANVTAGAYLTTVTPAYGSIKVTDGEYVNGVRTYGTNVLYATSWPQFARIRLYGTAANYMVQSSGYPTLMPDMNGDIGVCFPRAAGDVRALTLQEKGSTVVVPSSSRATLQAVFDGYENKKLALANVTAGTYDTDGGVARGVTNRISFYERGASKTPYVKYVATNKTATVVKGGISKSPRDNENYPGCGPDAVRCVSFDCTYRTMSFTGMTFKDGRTDCNQSAAYDQGGAAYGDADHVTYLMFVDCVFTNCYAPDAGVGVNATFIRCKFKNCGSAGVGFKNCIVSSCVFENCDFKGGTFGENCITVNCSDPSGNAVGTGVDQVHVNSHFGFGTTLPSDAKDFGCSLTGSFANVSIGDLRPTSGSSAVDATRRPFPTDTTSADFTTFAETYAKYAELPYSGDEWVFGGDYPIAGACQDWVKGISIEEGANLSAYSVVSDGDTATVSRKADAVRHYGIVVDGVTTNLLDNGAESFPLADMTMTDGRAVSIIDQNWYVNANTDSSKGVVGSDENNGFTAATPKLTLKGVLSVATYAGDVVHAAAGVYNSETMGYRNDAPKIPIRARVADDVTLVGAGAESTFITGEKSSEAPVCGVYLGARARLADFTVCNCAATNVNGAAVISTYGTHAVVADCIISNNVAFMAAGTYNVDYVLRSRYYDHSSNRSSGTKHGVCASYARFFNCLFDRNDGESWLYSSIATYNCTFGNGVGSTGKFQRGGQDYNVMAYRVPRDNVTLYRSYSIEKTKNAGTQYLDNSVITNAAALAYVDQTSYTPVIGENVAIGMAEMSYYTNNYPKAYDPKGEDGMWLDLLGNPRVSNGTMDVGAVEADYRPVYAKIVGGRRCSVTNASSVVVLGSDGKTVSIPSGGALAAVWSGCGGISRQYQLNFRVNGSGTLTVTVNGATQSYTSASGTATWGFTNSLAENNIFFAYEGDGTADILQGASRSGVALILR